MPAVTITVHMGLFVTKFNWSTKSSGRHTKHTGNRQTVSVVTYLHCIDFIKPDIHEVIFQCSTEE